MPISDRDTHFVPAGGRPSNLQFLRFRRMLQIVVNLMLHVRETSENFRVSTIFKLAVLSSASLSVLVKGGTNL